MAGNTEKLAPVNITAKQKKHLKRKAYKSGVPITTIIRELIDKDIREGKL